MLQGARNILQKSLVVCVEFDDENEKNRLTALIGSAFEVLTEYGCNIIYFNKGLANEKKI